MGSGVLEINQASFAENLVAQYGISAKSNIPGSSGLDLGHRRADEPGGNEEFPQYRALVGSLMGLSVMIGPDIANALRAVHAKATTRARDTGRPFFR